MQNQTDYQAKQILRVSNVDGAYTINKVTEKAVLIECDNGNWIDNGKFVPLWVPKSIINYTKFNSSTDNSQYGMHIVTLPEWFINANSKKW